MRRTSVLSLLLLAGCPWYNPIDRDSTDSDTDLVRPCVDAEPDGCPCGLEPTTGATLAVTNMQVEGLAVFVDFTANATVFDGARDRPAACISADTTAASLIFEISGTPAGRVDVEAKNGTGNFAITEGDVEVAIDLFGYDPVTAVAKDGWSNGQVSVLAEGNNELEVNIVSASGIGTGNRILTAAMQITVDAP